MGKTRDLFKKIRDTKGTFHAKVDSIKDRNGMDQFKYTRKAESVSDSSVMGISSSLTNFFLNGRCIEQ